MDRDELAGADLTDETTYDALRLSQWLRGQARGDEMSRRERLRVFGAVGLAAAPVLAAVPGLAMAPGPRAAAGRGAHPAAANEPADSGPIVKPLPPDLYYVYGSNAEMRWEAMQGQGYIVPVDRFFVRNHTSTSLIDAATWRLKVFGAGPRGTPSLDDAVEFSYQDLLDLPADSLTAFIECADNGRSFFTSQQNESVTGTPWKLGAVGWRGVRLRTVLERPG